MKSSSCDGAPLALSGDERSLAGHWALGGRFLEGGERHGIVFMVELLRSTECVQETVVSVDET